MKEFYLKKLEERKEKNLYRVAKSSDFVAPNLVLREGKNGRRKLISFASNDYFSLSQNKQLKAAAIKATEKFGTSSTASRYICGANSLHLKLEKAIAKFKGFNDALIFPSGYSCCLGVVSALVEKGDLIVADRLIHASLIDGSLLSGAKLMRFAHNDFAQARKILQENRAQFKKCLIVSETVFSMDGDLGCVEELKKLAAEFDCLFLEDSAHEIAKMDCRVADAPRNDEAVGIVAEVDCFAGAGNDGGGISKVDCFAGAGNDGGEAEGSLSPANLSPANLSLTNLSPANLSPVNFSPANLSPANLSPRRMTGSRVERHLKIGTFSKAFASLGGFVCGSKELIDFLRNFARPQIYSTALPPSVLAACLQAVKIASKKDLGKKALENANYFCKLMNLPKAESAIVVIILQSEERVLKIAKKLEEKGFLISAIRYPTVEKNKARLRITFNALHKKKEIEKLAGILKTCLQAGF